MKMTELQFEMIKENLRQLTSKECFYKEKLKGIDIESIKTQEDFEKLPFTWKGDLREAYPLGLQAVPDEEVVRIVDEVIAYIKSTGNSCYVGPFETTIEGDYDQLMDIVKECQHVAERAGCKAMSVYVKIAYKPEGDVLTIEKKVTKHHQ